MLLPATIDVPQLLEEYYIPNRMLDASTKGIQSYRLSVKHWDSVHPKLPIPNIDMRSLSKFQNHLKRGHAPETVNGYTRPVMAVIRYAEELHLIERAPKVRMLRERKKTPLAATIEEFHKILAHVATLTEVRHGYRMSEFWNAVLLSDWETGLRYTSLLSIRTIDMLWDDCGFFTQPDTAKDLEADWYPLQEATLAAIKKIYDPQRELLFPRVLAPRTIERRFRQILDSSGIYAPKGSGMCFHRLRRSRASYVEAAGGDAQRALGHSCRKVTERYLDPRIVGKPKQPPSPMPTMPTQE